MKHLGESKESDQICNVKLIKPYCLFGKNKYSIFNTSSLYYVTNSLLSFFQINKKMKHVKNLVEDICENSFIFIEENKCDKCANRFRIK